MNDKRLRNRETALRRLPAFAIAIVALAALILVPGCGRYTTSGAVAVSAGNGIPFYSDLSPYGYWFDDADYGSCWTPYDMDPFWRPYTLGRWEYTDFGWTWLSDEPWGWVTSHYGRWAFDATYGWIWVPGSVWGPAWVTWRDGDGWIGWAPLPPRADRGARRGILHRRPPREEAWSFVSREHFTDRDLSRRIATAARNKPLLERTRGSAPTGAIGREPRDGGPGIAEIERATGRNVVSRKIVPAERRGPATERHDGGIEVARPAHPERPAHAASREPAAREPQAMPAERVAQARIQLQQEIRQRAAQQEQRMRVRHEHEKVAPGAIRDRTLAQRQRRENAALRRLTKEQRRIFDERVRRKILPREHPRRGRRADGHR